MTSIIVDPRKTVRIIAYNKVNIQHLRSVNVFTTAPTKKEFPERLQAGAAPQKNEFPTVMASGAANPTQTNGLPNIYVAGYSGPI